MGEESAKVVIAEVVASAPIVLSRDELDKDLSLEVFMKGTSARVKGKGESGIRTAESRLQSKGFKAGTKLGRREGSMILRWCGWPG